MGDIEFGKRLKQARESKKLTQQEVADKLGIGKPQTISAYETGKNDPSIDTLRKLSEIYDVSTDELLFGSERKVIIINDYDNVLVYDKEFLKRLVYSADMLGLRVTNKYTSEPEKFHFCIELTDKGDNYVIDESYLHFVRCWKQYRDLLEQKMINYEEYRTLLDRKLNAIVDSPFQEYDPFESYR